MSAATFVLTGKRRTNAHFPFGESADDLENSLSRRKAWNCKGIPEELFPVIRGIKPYPHEGDQWWLKTLQKVSGTHKHGVALTLGSAAATPFQKMEMRGTAKDGSAVSIVTHILDWSAAEKEFVVATTTGLGPDGGMHLSAPFHIAFDHPELKPIQAGMLIDRWGLRTDAIITVLEKAAANILAERGE